MQQHKLFILLKSKLGATLFLYFQMHKFVYASVEYDTF